MQTYENPVVDPYPDFVVGAVPLRSSAVLGAGALCREVIPNPSARAALSYLRAKPLSRKAAPQSQQAALQKITPDYRQKGFVSGLPRWPPAYASSLCDR